MGEGETAVPIESRALQRYKLIEPFLQGSRTLASIAGQADVNLRTAQRWVDLYRRNGLEALAQKQRVDRGIKRAMSQRMVQTIEGLALEKPRVPISAIYRELQEFTAKPSMGHLWPVDADRDYVRFSLGDARNIKLFRRYARHHAIPRLTGAKASGLSSAALLLTCRLSE